MIFGAQAPSNPLPAGKDMDAAIREVKKHPKPPFRLPLQPRFPAGDRSLPRKLVLGGGAINQVNIHLFIETMPFGGVGYSGIRSLLRVQGRVWTLSTHAKSVLISPPDL